MTRVIVTSEEDRRRQLAAFLIGRRERMAAGALALRPYPRPRQHGDGPVGVAEVALAIGVSERWYTLVEQAAPTRPSPRVVDRLVRAFALDPLEAEMLWDLAIPVVRTRPREQSRRVIEAYASMQWYLRKLSSASSIDEVITLAEETACSHFPEVSFIVAMSRTPNGTWRPHGEGLGTARAMRRVWRQYGEIHRPLGERNRAGLDQLMGYPAISQPGELLTFDDLDGVALNGILKDARRRYERNNGAELLARMRSRDGFVGHLFFADFLKNNDRRVDREIAATIVDFASLALN